jgi:hypothetical protein
MRHLISSEYNSISGLTTQYFSVDGGKKIHIKVLQDVEPLLKQNRVELNQKSAKARKFRREGLGTKVASIPNGIVEQLRQERGINILTCSEKQLKQILNDSEFSGLRTSHGRI